MNKDEIIQAINLLEISKECTEISEAAKERGKAIRRAEYERQIDEYWSRALFYREGQTLFCNAEGTFIGGPMQRGDKCKVLDMDIDRKNPRIWVMIGKRSYGFPPHEAYRYRLLPNKPDKPISSLDRTMAQTVAKIMDDADRTR
jgi:hypothetical protein